MHIIALTIFLLFSINLTAEPVQANYNPQRGHDAPNDISSTGAREPCVVPEVDCLDSLVVAEGPEFTSYYRTYSLSELNPAINQVVIVIHGTNRNANTYFRAMVDAVTQAGLLDTTLVIAPHFKANAGSCRDSLEDHELYWSCNGWKDGQAALNRTIKTPVYSFDVIDRFIEVLNDPLIFSNLKNISVTGHSAGGQFMQRYAAGNHAEPVSDAPLKYIIANPSSYMYLDDRRIERDATCFEDGTCTGRFRFYWDYNNCPHYNDYKYGMDNRTGYMAFVDDAAIRNQFTTRSIIYLLGELDTELDSDLDISCSAMAQGGNRRERGTIFWNYMRIRYHTDQGFVIVPGCGHSASCMYQSEEAIQAVLF